MCAVYLPIGYDGLYEFPETWRVVFVHGMCEFMNYYIIDYCSRCHHESPWKTQTILTTTRSPASSSSAYGYVLIIEDIEPRKMSSPLGHIYLRFFTIPFLEHFSFQMIILDGLRKTKYSLSMEQYLRLERIIFKCLSFSEIIQSFVLMCLCIVVPREMLHDPRSLFLDKSMDDIFGHRKWCTHDESSLPRNLQRKSAP